MPYCAYHKKNFWGYSGPSVFFILCHPCWTSAQQEFWRPPKIWRWVYLQGLQQPEDAVSFLLLKHWKVKGVHLSKKINKRALRRRVLELRSAEVNGTELRHLKTHLLHVYSTGLICVSALYPVAHELICVADVASDSQKLLTPLVFRDNQGFFIRLLRNF